MDVVFAGINTPFSCVHPLQKFIGISVTEAELIRIYFRFWHPRKTPVPILSIV